MDPNDPSAAGDSIDLASSRPLGETDGLSLPGVVKGFRSFVRTEPPDDATSELAPVFDQTSPRDRLLAAYHQLQASLKATRNHRRPHQTPLEHAYWLGEKPAQTDESFQQVHRVLYRVLYGRQEASEDEVRSVRNPDLRDFAMRPDRRPGGGLFRETAFSAR